jgi:hypothetical protein
MGIAIAIAIGSWSLASALLGLLLGRLFGRFAKRRRAEEELFTRIEQTQIFSGLKVGSFPFDFHPGSRSPQGVGDQIAGRSGGWGAATWTAPPAGRMIQ